jgi:cation diffusion facilitator family transporter
MLKEKNKVALISVLAAIFLTGFKLTIGTLTNSLGILSEALHSGLDLVAAVITLFAVKISIKDADKDHHYGHGKIENFSALIETLLLFVTCFWICWEAVHRLISGKVDIQVTIFSYIVVITSICIDVWRSKKLMRTAKKHNSQALEADALHFSTDIWSSAVVLLGLICVTIGKIAGITLFNYADAFAALCVAIIVIHVSWRLGKRAVDALLDKVPDCADDIETIVKRFENIKSYHTFKVRQSGNLYYVDLCVHVNDKYSLTESHNISDDLEKEIKKFNSNIIVNVHVEPNNHK